MATPNLLELSRDLAYKLQDPVSNGSSNGERFTAYHRLRYIIRGYRRLLRLLEELLPEQINKIFTNYFKVNQFTSSSVGILGMTASSIREALEVLVRWQSGTEEWIRADYIDPMDYLSIETGQNDFYSPDLNQQRVFWTMIGDNISLLPQVQYTMKVFYIGSIPNFEYNGSTDIDMPIEFFDILLALAASEAYLDVGEFNMSTAFKGDANDQIRILATVKKEAVEGDNEKTIE